MIDFACKQFDIKEIIKCSLGLTKAELDIFLSMIEEQKETTSQELAKRKKLDLSTVQRTLKKLIDKGLVARRQINLESGGYIYSYQINNKKMIRDKILSIINNWTNKVEKELGVW